MTLQKVWKWKILERKGTCNLLSDLLCNIDVGGVIQFNTVDNYKISIPHYNFFLGIIFLNTMLQQDRDSRPMTCMPERHIRQYLCQIIFDNHYTDKIHFSFVTISKILFSTQKLIINNAIIFTQINMRNFFFPMKLAFINGMQLFCLFI